MKAQKIQNLLLEIQKCLKNGNYRLSSHALIRGKERFLSLPNILEVLKHGYHEKAKDKWDSEFEAWNYAVRGFTINKELCRIIVSFEDNGLLIITVIKLD